MARTRFSRGASTFLLGLLWMALPLAATARIASGACSQAAILQPATFKTLGLKARGVALGDFNQDGILDAAICGPETSSGSSANSVFVMLGGGSGGVGDGTFGPPATVLSGIRPWAVVTADFDGDGHLDLVTSNLAGNDVTFLHGNGNGTFGALGAFAAGANPFEVVTADFNHDGILDLAVSNNGAATVSVLIGLGSGGVGNGTFAPPASYPIANISTGIAAGDLNHDGNVDIVATANYSGLVAVLLGTGTGTFAAAQHYPAGVEPFDVMIRDLDSDGIPDLAVGNSQSAGISILRGNGNGTFAAPYVEGSGINVAQIAVADFNGDGTPDLAVACNTTNSVDLLLGQSSGGLPNGHFTFQGAYAGPGFPLSLATSDLNSDGYPDVVVSGYTSANMAVLLGGCFTPPQYPHLVSVRDVPNDQGGKVFLRWIRSSLDTPGSGTVTGYRVWRRLPPGLAASRAATVARPAVAGIDYWEAIATLPAEGLAGYGYTAPTTQDSMAGSNPYTAFFVTALTQSSATFYESNVDSGYSVDNLGPPPPAPFAAVYGSTSTALHWTASHASDLLEYRLYRGAAPDFIPDPGNLILTTRDTTYMDGGQTGASYKLVAADIHGNVSRYLLASPLGPVATLVSLVGVDALSDRIGITWYSAADPDRPAMVYRRTEGTDWVSVRSASPDKNGMVRFEDLDIVAGIRYGYRLGVWDGDAEMFGGEVWASSEAPRFALEGVRPNPSPNGRLSVQFVLGGPEPARIELFDVGGRRVVAREVGNLGLGRHSVDLTGTGRLPAGLYLIRLHQGGKSNSARVVVLN